MSFFSDICHSRREPVFKLSSIPTRVDLPDWLPRHLWFLEPLFWFRFMTKQRRVFWAIEYRKKKPVLLFVL